jgi:hypothetical protein
VSAASKTAAANPFFIDRSLTNLASISRNRNYKYVIVSQKTVVIVTIRLIDVLVGGPHLPAGLATCTSGRYPSRRNGKGKAAQWQLIRVKADN